ncbi:hypothetical protein GGR56DRAFT_658371 [Xylariaceae sp. FL0804]|nr:hypothetical protein GGR56DRAFT_658371 [Xylariaceae sp. FL0804]
MTYSQDARDEGFQGKDEGGRVAGTNLRGTTSHPQKQPCNAPTIGDPLQLTPPGKRAADFNKLRDWGAATVSLNAPLILLFAEGRVSPGESASTATGGLRWTANGPESCNAIGTTSAQIIEERRYPPFVHIGNLYKPPTFNLHRTRKIASYTIQASSSRYIHTVEAHLVLTRPNLTLGYSCCNSCKSHLKHPVLRPSYLQHLALTGCKARFIRARLPSSQPPRPLRAAATAAAVSRPSSPSFSHFPQRSVHWHAHPRHLTSRKLPTITTHLSPSTPQLQHIVLFDGCPNWFVEPEPCSGAG